MLFFLSPTIGSFIVSITSLMLAFGPLKIQIAKISISFVICFYNINFKLTDLKNNT